MGEHLTPGRFFGKTIHRRKVADLVLADVSYAPGSRVPRHAHERPYFCLIRSGTYTETYGRRERVCRPGVITFHPPGEQHAEAFGERSVASFNVELGPEWLYRMCEAGGAVDQPLEFHGGAIARLSLRLFEELRRSDLDSTATIESLTAEILGACLLREVGSHKTAPRWLVRARERLHAHFEEPLSLNTLAKEAGVHPVHFAASFRRFCGCSAGEYLRRLRLQHLSSMLRRPDTPLSEIAHATGFADQSHFTRFLKRFTGLTPTQYRTFLTFKTPEAPRPTLAR